MIHEHRRSGGAADALAFLIVSLFGAFWIGFTGRVVMIGYECAGWMIEWVIQ